MKALHFNGVKVLRENSFETETLNFIQRGEWGTGIILDIHLPEKRVTEVFYNRSTKYKTTPISFV